MKSVAAQNAPSSDPAEQLAGFIAKFEPEVGLLIDACRAEVRKLLPTTIELVYDNYNFLAIGYSTTGRPSDCIVSIAAAANGVGLSFYYGATLPDPEGLLLGSGKQNRFIRLPSVEPFRAPGVLALIQAAIAQAEPPPLPKGGGTTVIKSISAKQRPRRKV
ncbi:MAG TPA: hypothetical protein VGS22_08540 [Thermoanaerobaculia bacterium]|jgi:hypothetical protein|nr:hypothetical protein [Thermoanaerobaculia bacterium]